jgi:NADPH:quinone reductase-like Zn-dependent oxidoreductase
LRAGSSCLSGRSSAALRSPRVVQATGQGVANLTVGDRVFAFTTPALPFLGARAGGWQQYAILTADFLARIPGPASFEEAVTVPVGFLTALDAIIKLKLTWPGDATPKNSAETILVWGRSSCVGRNAIWLLKQAGYTNVFTTASASRMAKAKELGAAHVFDYDEKDIVITILAVSSQSSSTRSASLKAQSLSAN